MGFDGLGGCSASCKIADLFDCFDHKNIQFVLDLSKLACPTLYCFCSKFHYSLFFIQIILSFSYQIVNCHSLVL